MMGSVPNQPKTKHMSFRIDDDLKADVTRIAAAKDESASDVVRRAFEAYRDENKELL